MKFESPSEFFYKINQQFNWVLSAPLGIFIFLYLEWRDSTWKSYLTDPDYIDVVTYALLPIVMLLWSINFRQFRKNYKSIDATLPLSKKLELLFGFYIKSQIVYTVSALFAMLGLFLTGSDLFAAYYLTLIFYTSFNRPSANFVSKLLQLEKDDREILIRKKPF